MKIKHLPFFVSLLIILNSCSTSTIEPDETSVKITDQVDYLSLKSAIATSTTNFNFFSNELIHMGRVLFYDKHLSANNKFSCASCHRQELAFADGQASSVGISAQMSTRNTPSIVNTASAQGLFWDQRALNLMDLVLQPVANHAEMGISNESYLVDKLNELGYYKDLNQRAFGMERLSINHIQQALVAFTSQLNSFDSKFDQGFDALSPLEQSGKNLFVSKNCNNCHNVINPIFDFGIFEEGNGYTGASVIGNFANIGLDMEYDDNGVGALNGFEKDNGKFSIPTLRNLAYTAPYMHDGRFKTLDEVLDFYSNGVQNHKNLDSRLKLGETMGIQLNAYERQAIKAFLLSMTGDDLMHNPAYSDPFVQ
ncbi:MAG: hypothetical protein KDC16_08805 [Saprospiraceae bacterium]|nr:hypothetical protein [Saprospiraceae bacterium]MCB9328576.1 hypothetical protein [Lewinellaceae bacterium]HPK10005.1 cytochrome c peroxidase [Saprospiraceae bacterium]